MCNKLKYYLCSECEEWEIQLDPCFVDFEEDVICNHCFNEKTDELSLTIIKCMEEGKKLNSNFKEAKMRRKK